MVYLHLIDIVFCKLAHQNVHLASRRQALRRKAAIASGSIGNKNSNGYLDALSPKGDGGPALKKTSWKKSSEVSSWKKSSEVVKEGKSEQQLLLFFG